MPVVAETQARDVNSRTHFVWGLAGTCVLAAGVAAFLDQPLIAAGILGLVPAGLAIAGRPELFVPVVFFSLYTNAAVVAVRFHGIPRIVGQLTVAPLLIPLVYYVIIRRDGIIVTSTFPFIVAFLCLQFISALFSVDPNVAIDSLKVSVIEGLALYLLVTNVVRTGEMARKLVWVLLAAGALMGGLSLFQVITGTEHINYGGFAQVGEGRGVGMETAHGMQHQPRLCGPIGEQNRYAQIMLMLVPLGMFCFAGEESRHAKSLAIGAMILILAGCMLTFSRGAAIAFAILLMMMSVMRYIKVHHLAGIAVIALSVVLAVPQYRTRMMSIPAAAGILDLRTASNEPDGAIRGRATVMLGAARLFADYPVLGVGPGNFNALSRKYSRRGGLRALDEDRESHCLYLEFAAEQGVLGLGCFVLLVSVSLTRLAGIRRQLIGEDRKSAHLATGFLLAVVAYLATALFLHFSYQRYFWLMLGLADSTSVALLRERLSSRDQLT